MMMKRYASDECFVLIQVALLMLSLGTSEAMVMQRNGLLLSQSIPMKTIVSRKRSVLHVHEDDNDVNSKESEQAIPGIKSEWEDIDEDEDIAITDELALLACRAYLRRHKRLPWTQAEQRKKLAKQASASLRQENDSEPWAQSWQPSSIDGSVGYFWEDPSELMYLREEKSKLLSFETDGSIIYNGEVLDDDSGDVFQDDIQEPLPSRSERIQRDSNKRKRSSIFSSLSSRRAGNTDMDDEEDQFDREEDNEEDGDYSENMGSVFTSFPAFPPDEFVRRSDAAKRRWADENFRADWYEKRWKGKTSIQMKKERQQRQRDQKIQSMVNALSEEVLNSPEMASMTEEELNEAIQTYINANRKRSRSHKANARRNQEPQIDNSENETPNQPLSMTADEMTLKEAQQKRSERAVLAYKTRVINQRKKQSEEKQKPDRTEFHESLKQLAIENSPKDAIIRIEADLDMGRMPAARDVRLILKPGRMSRRKHVLVRILSDCFDLRGKCVPSKPWKKEIDGVKEYVTKSPTSLLGDFVLQNLEDHLLKMR